MTHQNITSGATSLPPSRRRILIVGAGLSGCTLAERFASLDNEYDITIIEKRNHIGGNCYDYIDELGILMNKYGAHIFHTNSDRVWDYVNRFCSWTSWHHKIVGKIDDVTFPIPVNIDTVNILCGTNLQNEEDMIKWLSANTAPKSESNPPINSEEVALQRVGPTLFEKIFKHYTFKQWAKYPHELHPSVLERIPVRTNRNEDYFSDKHQAIPTKGYTEFVRAMIDHPSIKVHLNTDYTHDMRKHYDLIFYTGPIDAYYAEYNYPKLEYRSIRFEKEVLVGVDYYQPNSVVNYPSNKESFTRIVEYKHFLDQKVPGKTAIVKEYTMSEGEPFYPVPTKVNQDTYRLYQELAEKDEAKGVYFLGRLANYKYYNMDGAIENALVFFDKFVNNNITINIKINHKL